MAYSDYGGYAYRNGERVVERSDVALSEAGLAATPGMWPGWSIEAGRAGGSHHVLLGDGPLYLSLRKQSTVRLYRLHEEQDLLSLVAEPWIQVYDHDPDKTRYINSDHGIASGEAMVAEFDGHRLTVYFTHEDNHYVYAQLEQPDGVVWNGFSGYGVGAGLEDAGYGFSTDDRESMLWELFQKPDAEALARQIFSRNGADNEHLNSMERGPTGPTRIQRSRRKGWKMPAGAVYVGRPTKWGNPFRPNERADDYAVLQYRAALSAGELPVSIADVRRELRGKDLVCWCALDKPCHADVLLSIANEPAGQGGEA